MVIFTGTAPALPFAIGPNDKDEYHFIIDSPGEIRVQASWTGTASNLALILNGPGQVTPYAGQDGSSPLELEILRHQRRRPIRGKLDDRDLELRRRDGAGD
jgi:hypothetical protein